MSTRRRAFVLGITVLACSLAGSSSARAEPLSAAAPSLSPPPLTVSLTPGSGGGTWKLKVENTGDVPVRIAADPRLLVLEVTPPAGFVDEAAAKAKAKTTRAAAAKVQEPKPVRCELPADARPTTDEARELVVPAKRSWSSPVDPLFYCFGARERAVLVNGATVKARFGWPLPPPKPTTRGRTKPAAVAPPFVATPVGAAVGKVTPVKELEVAPFTLTENANGAAPAAPATNGAAPAAPAANGAAPAAPATPASSLSLSMAAAQDASRGVELSTTVTVANEGDKAVTLLFRPETLRFAVAGPAGSVSCGATRSVEAPIRELYSTVGARGRASTSLLLTTMCPPDTFDEPGLYRITPELDTTQASARSIGLKSWDGTVAGKSPMLLRVRSPRRPSTMTTTRPIVD